jgi:hypothetical protein
MTIIDCIFIIVNFNRFDRESVKKIILDVSVNCKRWVKTDIISFCMYVLAFRAMHSGLMAVGPIDRDDNDIIGLSIVSMIFCWGG